MCTKNRPQQLFLPKRSPLKRQQAHGAALAGTEPQREETSARCQFERCQVWWRETPPHTLIPAPTDPGSGPSTVPWVRAARGGRQRLCSRPCCGGGSQLGTGRLVLSKRPLFSACGFGKKTVGELGRGTRPALAVCGWDFGCLGHPHACAQLPHLFPHSCSLVSESSFLTAPLFSSPTFFS